MDLDSPDSEEYDEDQDVGQEEEETDSEDDIPATMPMLKAFDEKFQQKLNATTEASESPRANSDDERTEIRKELSTLSFEELQKLKQRIGCKKYQEAMHGKQNDVQEEFFRANKNRPREASSKAKLRPNQPLANTVKPRAPRDPRFDPLCGEYKERSFRNRYDFINEMRMKELGQLQKELREEENPKRKEKVKYLIQRLKNQVREQKKHHEEEQKREEAKQATIEALKAGKKPFFSKKSNLQIKKNPEKNAYFLICFIFCRKGDVKKAELVQKFQDLSSKGTVDQYLAKKRKRNAQRDRKSLPSTSRE
nr:EOG090X0E8U [Lepidurus arcticus]